MLLPRPPKNKSWPGDEPLLAHLTARDYVRHGYVPKEVWARFFTFGLVRNPYARVESLYFYLGAHKRMSFDAFVADRLLQGPRRQFHAPATRYLTGQAGHIRVDQIYRLEEISDAWGNIQDRAKLPQVLPHVNAAKQREKVIWGDAARACVRQAYAKDFALFGYDVDSGALKPPEAKEVWTP